MTSRGGAHWHQPAELVLPGARRPLPLPRAPPRVLEFGVSQRGSRGLHRLRRQQQYSSVATATADTYAGRNHEGPSPRAHRCSLACGSRRPGSRRDRWPLPGGRGQRCYHEGAQGPRRDSNQERHRVSSIPGRGRSIVWAWSRRLDRLSSTVFKGISTSRLVLDLPCGRGRGRPVKRRRPHRIFRARVLR